MHLVLGSRSERGGARRAPTKRVSLKRNTMRISLGGESRRWPIFLILNAVERSNSSASPGAEFNGPWIGNVVDFSFTNLNWQASHTYVGQKKLLTCPDFLCWYTYLVVEEMYGVFVESKWERFQEWNVIGHDLLVGEVKLVDNDRIHMVVRQKIIWNERKQNTNK